MLLEALGIKLRNGTNIHPVQPNVFIDRRRLLQWHKGPILAGVEAYIRSEWCSLLLEHAVQDAIPI